MNTFQFKLQIQTLLLLIFLSTPALSQYTDTNDENPNGKVHKFKLEWADYYEIDSKILANMKERWLLLADVEYDVDHNILKEYHHYRCANGLDRRKREVVVNNLHVAEFVYGKDGNIEEKFTHLKDAEGRIIQTDHFDVSGNLIDTWLYNYKTDSHGNWIIKESDWKNYSIPEERHFIYKIVERRTISYF